ncbi:hypothetical protein HZB00_01540 [Candidatus Woesearchaeota archaeon]|nr:hypothetical protein [Candidatus Woesearchaeota archaeon]
MKCPHCKQGILEKYTGVMEEDGISYEALRCSQCGEEIMTMPQLKELAKKYRKLRKAKEVTFAQWGNSLAVRIPNDVVQEYKLASGKRAVLTKDKQGIRIIPE